MLHPVDRHPPDDVGDGPADPWPIVVVLAVMGPLALALAIAAVAG